MTLTDVDDDDDEDLCTALIAVLQKDRRKKRKQGVDLLTIGYVIYKVGQDLDLKWGRLAQIGQVKDFFISDFSTFWPDYICVFFQQFLTNMCVFFKSF